MEREEYRIEIVQGVVLREIRGVLPHHSSYYCPAMGKKGKKAQAGKPKKLTPKEIGKRLDALVKKLEEELKGADLFAPLPPTEDCAICCVPLPRVQSELNYRACCGNEICFACTAEHEAHVMKQNAKGGKKMILNACAFCRTPPPSVEEYVRQLENRAFAKADCVAMNQLGKAYSEGDCGLPKDELKALDCWIKATELGSEEACNNIGECFRDGTVISQDFRKGALMEGVGAVRGLAAARHNVGCTEYRNIGNHEIGIRHFKIAAKAGFQPSLNILRNIYNNSDGMPGKEFICKSELAEIYRLCHQAQEKVHSAERQKHRTGEDKIKYSPGLH